MNIRISSQRDIWIYTALITLISVAVPLAVVGAIFRNAPFGILRVALVIAGLIPLGIAPPVSYVALTLIRNMTTAPRG